MQWIKGFGGGVGSALPSDNDRLWHFVLGAVVDARQVLVVASDE